MPAGACLGPSAVLSDLMAFGLTGFGPFQGPVPSPVTCPTFARAHVSAGLRDSNSDPSSQNLAYGYSVSQLDGPETPRVKGVR